MSRFKKRVINTGELKFNTFTESTDLSTNYGGAGTWNSIGVATANPYMQLDYITQGDDITERDGRNVYLKGVLLDGWIRSGANVTTESYSTFRVSLFKYNRDVGFNPRLAADYALTTEAWSPRQSTKAARCNKVIYDRKFTINYSRITDVVPADSAGRVARRFKLYIPINEIVRYDGTVNNQAQFHYYLTAVSGDTVPGGLIHTRGKVFFRDY